MVAAFSQGWPKGCEGRCAGRGAQGCPSEQGPCTPGGCVLGQGLCRLPGSALSLPGELPTALWENLWVEGAALHVSGLLKASDHPTTLAEAAFQEESQGRGYLEDEDLSRVCDLTFLLRERGKEMSGLNTSLRLLNCYTEGSAHLQKPPKVPSPTPLPTGSTSITFACSISADLP